MEYNNSETTERFSLVKEPINVMRTKANTSTQVSRYAREMFTQDLGVQECFYAIYTDHGLNTIGFALISMGAVTATLVDIRLVAKYGVATLASGCILVHNHPSGNPDPSEADKLLTKKIKSALDLFSIKLLDHIILTDDSYYSFADEGLI